MSPTIVIIVITVQNSVITVLHEEVVVDVVVTIVAVIGLIDQLSTRPEATTKETIFIDQRKIIASREQVSLVVLIGTVVLRVMKEAGTISKSFEIARLVEEEPVETEMEVMTSVQIVVDRGIVEESVEEIVLEEVDNHLNPLLHQLLTQIALD